MPQGTLEVRLVSAKGLKDTDFICKCYFSAKGLKDTDFISNIDAYCILKCGTQERKSTVASGEGSKPEWNETYLFTITKGVTSLNIKIMDKDTFSDDDFLGETTISLRVLFEEGSIPPISYNVIKDKNYCGEIRVGLKFTKKARDGAFLEENFGGWKQSSISY